MKSIVLILLISLVAISSSAKSEKDKCLDAGGEWRSWTKYEVIKKIESCRVKAKDAGKACIEGKDCKLGFCEYEIETKSGSCTEYGRPLGCHTLLEKGGKKSRICVD